MQEYSSSIFGIDWVTIFTSTLGMRTPYLINWSGDTIFPSVLCVGTPDLLGCGGCQIFQGDTEFTRKFGEGIPNLPGYQIMGDPNPL